MILFLARSLGLTEKVVKLGLIGIAILAVLGAVLWLQSRERADDTANQNIGAQGAVVAGQAQTLEQVEKANEAEQDLRAGGNRSAARYAECLQNSRTKSRCEQFNPAVAD